MNLAKEYLHNMGKIKNVQEKQNANKILHIVQAQMQFT